MCTLSIPVPQSPMRVTVRPDKEEEEEARDRDEEEARNVGCWQGTFSMWLLPSSQCEAHTSSWAHVLVPSLLPQEKVLGGQPQLHTCRIPVISDDVLGPTCSFQMQRGNQSQSWMAPEIWVLLCLWSAAEDLGHDLKQTLAVAMFRRECRTSSIVADWSTYGALEQECPFLDSLALPLLKLEEEEDSLLSWQKGRRPGEQYHSRRWRLTLVIQNRKGQQPRSVNASCTVHPANKSDAWISATLRFLTNLQVETVMLIAIRKLRQKTEEEPKPCLGFIRVNSENSLYY